MSRYENGEELRNVYKHPPVQTFVCVGQNPQWIGFTGALGWDRDVLGSSQISLLYASWILDSMLRLFCSEDWVFEFFA